MDGKGDYREINCYLGSAPIRIYAKNESVVNVTVNIVTREPDSLRRFAENILNKRVAVPIKT